MLITNNTIQDKSINNLPFTVTKEDINKGNLKEKLFYNNKITLKEASQLEELWSKRSTMCGIGTKRLKNFLNRKAKEGDKVAEILYVALKVEDQRISSRMWSEKYRNHNAKNASSLLYDLLDLIEESGIGDYGFMDLPFSDFALSKSEQVRLLCIDLPGCEQITYVVPFDWKCCQKPYNGELKKSGKTILAKLADAIDGIYGAQIIKKYKASGIMLTNVKLPDIVIEKHENYACVLERKLYRDIVIHQTVTPLFKHMNYDEFVNFMSNHPSKIIAG